MKHFYPGQIRAQNTLFKNFVLEYLSFLYNTYIEKTCPCIHSHYYWYPKNVTYFGWVALTLRNTLQCIVSAFHFHQCVWLCRRHGMCIKRTISHSTVRAMGNSIVDNWQWTLGASMAFQRLPLTDSPRRHPPPPSSPHEWVRCGQGSPTAWRDDDGWCLKEQTSRIKLKEMWHWGIASLSKKLSDLIEYFWISLIRIFWKSSSFANECTTYTHTDVSVWNGEDKKCCCLLPCGEHGRWWANGIAALEACAGFFLLPHTVLCDCNQTLQVVGSVSVF